MQIVINISDELYNYMQTEGYDEHLDRRFDYQIRFAVKNGAPLPKGHGRLIDADKLWDSYYDLDYDFYDAVDFARTIIEADKAESEDKK